eukprot:68466_1
MGKHSAADNRRRSKLFQFILRTLVQQSKLSLDVLTIDVPTLRHVCNASFDYPPFSVLLSIMNEFDQLPISKLFWNKDAIKPSKDCTVSDVLLAIQSKFVHFFPKLTSVSVGTLTVFTKDNRWRWSHNSATSEKLQFASLKQHILAPTIVDFRGKLESLEINVKSFWNLLQRNGNVIQLIAKHMTNLKRLAISTSIMSDDDSGDLINMNDLPVNNISQHTQIKILKLTIKWSDYVNRMENLAKYINAGLLQFLFSTFIGITEFEYDFHRPWVSHLPGIDWDDVFSKLIQGKRMYSMNKEHDALPPLESLQFKRSGYEEGIRIMKSILHLRYCDLKHIGMEFTSGGSSENIGVFSKYFVSFLRLYRSKNANLSSVHLNLGRTWYHVRKLPILDILRNIPPSITSIYLELPTLAPASKQLTQEKTKIVKQLCEMSLKRREGSKLETIAFDNLRLSPSDKKYLLFWFGFNNMISIIEKKYHLRFI